MGSGASISADGSMVLSEAEISRITPVGGMVNRMMLDTLQATQQEVRAILDEVAKMDAEFVRRQMKLRWKQHAVIIQRVTCKSKRQLLRLKSIYNSPVNMGGMGRNLTVDVREMLGGPYGEFMRSILMSWIDCSVEYLECALAGLGCDETMLIDVVCLATEAELSVLRQFLTDPQRINSQPIVNLKKIIGKTRKGSCFQLFLLRALQGDRPIDDPTSIDKRKAPAQAQALWEAITAKPPDYATYFDLLCSVSRGQCQVIGEEYQLSYNSSLAKDIGTRFQGSIMRALYLWIAPRPEAIAMSLHYALNITTDHDIEASMHAVSRVLSAVDKHEASTWVKEQYFSSYGETLEAVIGQKVTGKLKEALLGWISSEAFDGGLVGVIADLVAARGGSGGEGAMETASMKALSPLAKCLMNVNNVNELTELLDRERSALRAYVLELQSRNNDEDVAAGSLKNSTVSSKEKQSALRAATDNTKISRKVAEAPIAESALAEVPEKVTADASKPDIAPQGAASGADFDAKFKRTCAFLKKRFVQFDVDRSGELDTNEFWELINNLNLGFSSHEIDGMRAWCDWDNDGKITYAESVNELADHIITTMEGSGLDVMHELDALERDAKNEKKSKDQAPAALPVDQDGDATPPSSSEAIPPNLNQYLYDSFQRYDTDKSGTLDVSEFWPFIQSVFSHNLTDDDLEALQAAFDRDGDGMVTWEEAIASFSTKLAELKTDKRDVWLGLVDRPTGLLFWYNLRDETSFWMNDEDQQKFKAFEIGAEGETKGDALAGTGLPVAPTRKK